jgi:hypothetical protein
MILKKLPKKLAKLQISQETCSSVLIPMMHYEIFISFIQNR